MTADDASHGVQHPPLLLATGSTKLALDKVLHCLSIPLNKDQTYTNNYSVIPNSFDGLLIINDKQVGTILADLFWNDAFDFCEMARLNGIRNQIVDIGRRCHDFSRDFLIESWDGKLASLTSYCLHPQPISSEKFSKSCLPYVRARLRHDLPKLIMKPDDPEPKEFFRLVNARLARRQKLSLHLHTFLGLYQTQEEAIEALINLIWRKE